MPQRWNAQREVELVAEMGRLEGEVVVLRTKCNDMFASDAAWTPERTAEYQALQSREQGLADQIVDMKADLSDLRLSKPRSLRGERGEPAAFARFLRGGIGALASDEVAEQADMVGEAEHWGVAHGAGTSFMVTPSQPMLGGGGLGEVRMDTASDAASGQNLIDTQTLPRLVERLANYGGIKAAAQVINTARGSPLRYPRIDASAQEGERVGAQGTDVNAEDIPNIGFTELSAYTYSSKAISVTVEMVQDSEFDIMGFIERQAVRRLGRITNKEFTTADGAAKPQGIVPLATTTTAAAAAEAITWQEALTLQYDVDDAYLEGGEMGMGGSPGESGGMVGYMMARDCERVLRTLNDMDGRPLWLPSIRVGVPDMLHGYPYVLNYHMASVASGAVSLMFGNFAYFVVRSAMAVMVHSFFDSRTARSHSFEVLAFCREDADAIGPLVANECPAFAALTMA